MIATKLCLFALWVALVSIEVPVSAASVSAQTCEGDCNGDGSVAIDEIILGVRAALGDAPIDDCRAMDGDGNGAVTVDELVAAVTRALQGCGPLPPTSTPTPTVRPTQEGDSVTVFDSRSAFNSAAGALLTDDYEDPGYAEFQDDASMDAVKGFTRYKTTFFPDFDEVIATPNGHIYAGGFTSGSFQLDLTAPSLGGLGVHAVGFDFANNIPVPYVAFVSFADGTSRNFMLHASAFQLLSPPPDFFGLTSSVEITRIHIGLMDGGATSDNLFAIDNLSLAAPETATITATPTVTPATTATNRATATATPTATRSTTPVTQTATRTPTRTATSMPTASQPPTATSAFTATRTTTLSLTSTPSPTSTPINDAALAASVRVATESIFRLFDLQASVGTAARVAGRARAATDGAAAAVSGCQQLDCSLFGTQEICCSDTQFSQFFDNCAFDDDLGRTVSLNGSFNLISDTADVCTGAIPVGANFAAFLSNFTQDVSFPDGRFSRAFQELSETFEVVPGGCTLSQPDQFGFGLRGDGRRFIDGEVQHFHGDGLGNILVDSASEVHALEIAVSLTQDRAGCALAAALNGSLTGADFRVGTQFKTDFIDLHVAQLPQAGALLLELTGTVGTDCLGDVSLSTVEPLRVASGDTCFTHGRLDAQLADGTVSATYTESGGLALDFGDGSTEQHFATCTDVPADKCSTSVVGLCGACSALDQCQRGLGCFPCSANCSGDTRRCSLSDAFATCEDGVF